MSQCCTQQRAGGETIIILRAGDEAIVIGISERFTGRERESSIIVDINICIQVALGCSYDIRSFAIGGIVEVPYKS